MEKQIIKEAKNIRKQLGGTIFSFPIEADNPFSSYAVVVYAGGEYFTYPEAAGISEAAAGVMIILEEYEKIGKVKDYDKDVRMVSYQAQINAPSVVMRRLKRGY